MRDRFQLLSVSDLIDSIQGRDLGEIGPADAARIEKSLIDHAIIAQNRAERARRVVSALEKERKLWNPIALYFQIQEIRSARRTVIESELDAEAFISAIPKTTVRRV